MRSMLREVVLPAPLPSMLVLRNPALKNVLRMRVELRSSPQKDESETCLVQFLTTFFGKTSSDLLLGESLVTW